MVNIGKQENQIVTSLTSQHKSDRCPMNVKYLIIEIDAFQMVLNWIIHGDDVNTVFFY